MQARVVDAKEPYEPIDHNDRVGPFCNFKAMPMEALSYIASIGTAMVGVVTSFLP